MSWREDQRESTTSDSQESIWLRFEPLKSVNDKTEVRMRILAGDPSHPGEPVGAWTHWFDSKPYNCSRPTAPCPVCEARNNAMQTSPDTYKNDYPMRYRYLFNVLVNENGKPVVKVFSFSSGLGKELKSYAERYGPLNQYDITVRKTQIGRLPMNVEYSLFYDGPRTLSAEEKEVSEILHELTQFTKPASSDVLASVARGEKPERQDNEQVRLISEIRRRIPGDVELTHFGIDVNNPPEVARLEALLQNLQG